MCQQNKGVDTGESTYIIYLDLQQHFDKIHQMGLLRKLSSHGV